MELNPKDSVAYNNMGMAMIELSDNEKAKSYYLKAISLDPGATDPRLNYAQLLNQEGNRTLIFWKSSLESKYLGNSVEAIATLQGFKASQRREQELIDQILETLKEQVKQQRAQTWDTE